MTSQNSRSDACGDAQARFHLLSLPAELRMQIYSYLPESCEIISAADLESFTSMGSLHSPVRRKWLLTGNSTLSLASTGHAIRAELLQHLLENFRIDVLGRKLPMKQIEHFMQHYGLGFDFWHNVHHVRATFDFFSCSPNELKNRLAEPHFTEELEELISDPLVLHRPDSWLRRCSLKHKRQQEDLKLLTDLRSLEIVYVSSAYAELWRDKSAADRQRFLQDLVDVIARNPKLLNVRLVIEEKGWEAVEPGRAQGC